jgi:hypothetical protein
MLNREECVSGMEQNKNPNDVTLMDVPTLLNREECVSGMEQNENTNDAAKMDAPIK